MSQWTLLGERRFWSLFWTQFLGAFNDNVFKNALVILIAYRSLSLWGLSSQKLVVLASGVFILPFLLFSAFSGLLADKFRKNVLIRWVKVAEVAIMALGGVGFFLNHVGLLLLVLFLMGAHSSLFGPSKFSILPELVREEELIGGTALVETGTFVSILLGTICGGLLIASGEHAALLTTLTVLSIAVAGVLTSRAIPQTPPGDPALKLRFDPISPLVSALRITGENRSVFLSILGISWFWFFGAGLLSVMPNYCKDVLRGDEHVVTFCLALFCVGIAVGSLLCERLSRRRLELGLVPFGSIGLSVFALDLYLVGSPFPPGQVPAQLLSLGEFLSYPAAWRVSIDLALLSIFGGVFTVPLYTLIQQRSPNDRRSRVIAGNNVLNALFMVLCSIMLFGLLAADVELPTVYLILALGNLAVAVYIYTLLPEFLLRFVTWILANLLYRLRVLGGDKIPVEGPCVLVCNHVTYVDWLLIGATCPRPPRFVMYHGFMKLPLVGVLLRGGKVIPIAPAHEDQGLLDEAFDRIAQELENGELVCIFPEGKITSHGEMNPFRTGIERIIARTPVPVLPLALNGMWGSFFSRKDHGKFRNPLRKLWARIDLRVGEQVPPEQVNAHDLAERVAALGGFTPPKVAD